MTTQTDGQDTGKTAVQVRRGDERIGADGCMHRVVSRTIDPTGSATIAYDVIRSSGGVHLRFDVIPPDAARMESTGFATPQIEQSHNCDEFA